MRDLALQWLVSFLDWGEESPFYAALTAGVIWAGVLALLWAMYDWVMPKFRVWRFRRRWYRM